MEKVTVFQTVHPQTAGMEVGAEKILVSPDGTQRWLALIPSHRVIISA